MLHLQGPQMLQMLEKSLRKSLPESLKVYGTVFHMNQGNPFKLKALVDDWPDFNTVVICPQEQDSKQHLDDAKTKHYYFLHPIFGKSVNQWKEMTDDLDHYSNTYVIYSKDPKNCKEFLGSPKVINWKQHLQIQSSQSNLDEVIGSLAAVQSCMVKKTQCFLYVIYETAKKLFPSVLDAKKLSPSGGKHKFINQELFKLSSLDVTHAALVNKFWHFGGNEKSQRFIERCIRTFPSFCLLGPEGTLVSWSLMDQTGELRMAGTMPEYRAQGLIYHVISAQIQALDKLGFPMYSHVDKSNHSMQRLSFNLQSVCMPCDWNQWKCVPR